MPFGGSTVGPDSSHEEFCPPYNDHPCKSCFDFDWSALEMQTAGRYLTLLRSASGGCYTCNILEKSISTLFKVKNPPKTRFAFTVGRYPNRQVDSPGKEECEENLCLYSNFQVWDIGENKACTDGIELYKGAGKNISSMWLKHGNHIVSLANPSRWALSMAVLRRKAPPS